jgi:hypothetical protein
VATVCAALTASGLTASCDAWGVVPDESGDIVDSEVVGLAEKLLVEPPCPSARAVDDEGFGECPWAGVEAALDASVGANEAEASCEAMRVEGVSHTVVRGAVDDELGREATQDDIGGDSPVFVFGREVEDLGREGKFAGCKSDQRSDLAAKSVVFAADLAATSGQVVSLLDQFVAFLDEIASLLAEVCCIVVELLRDLVGAGGQTLCFALRYKEALHRRDVDPGGRDGVGESPGGGLSLAEVLRKSATSARSRGRSPAAFCRSVLASSRR